MSRLLSLIRGRRHAAGQSGKEPLADLLAELDHDQQRAVLNLCESLDENAAPAERAEHEQAAASIIDKLGEPRCRHIEIVIERARLLDESGYFSRSPEEV